MTGGVVNVTKEMMRSGGLSLKEGTAIQAHGYDKEYRTNVDKKMIVGSPQFNMYFRSGCISSYKVLDRTPTPAAPQGAPDVVYLNKTIGGDYIPCKAGYAAGIPYVPKATSDARIAELEARLKLWEPPTTAETGSLTSKTKEPTKPVKPDVVYNLAAMAFMITSGQVWGVSFYWGDTPEGFSYWHKQHQKTTQEGRDKIAAMRKQFKRENG